jgi:V/A-type H+/Na+-transporting ATPase subunit E
VALEQLLTGLESEAKAAAACTKEQAREEAAKIIEAARVEARAIEDDAVRRGEHEIVIEAVRRGARARIAAAAALREAREECFGLLLAEVHARLILLRSSDSYRSVMRSLIVESLEALPAAAVLRVDARDEALVARILAELGRVLEVRAELETAGGVAVSSADGRAVRNTFDERLANAEPELRMLFGKDWDERPGTGPGVRREPPPEAAG